MAALEEALWLEPKRKRREAQKATTEGIHRCQDVGVAQTSRHTWLAAGEGKE